MDNFSELLKDAIAIIDEALSESYPKEKRQRCTDQEKVDNALSVSYLEVKPLSCKSNEGASSASR